MTLRRDQDDRVGTVGDPVPGDGGVLQVRTRRGLSGSIDESVPTDVWVLLGKITVSAGTTTTVTMTDIGPAGQYVAADAMLFAYTTCWPASRPEFTARGQVHQGAASSHRHNRHHRPFG